MSQNLQVLTAVRVTTILKALDDTRNLPANLVWSGRTKDVPAVDGEIKRVGGIGERPLDVQVADADGADAKADPRTFRYRVLAAAIGDALGPLGLVEEIGELGADRIGHEADSTYAAPNAVKRARTCAARSAWTTLP